MHRHHHLFERICTLENLIAAAHEALRGKRMRRPGAGFLADFEKEVCALHEELWAGAYRHRPRRGPWRHRRQLHIQSVRDGCRSRTLLAAAVAGGPGLVWLSATAPGV